MTVTDRHLALVTPPQSCSGSRFHHRLSRREHEVLELIAAGRTNAAIAEELVVSIGAVEKHVANIFMKLRLPATPRHHRRVLAALWHHRATTHVHARSHPAPASGDPAAPLVDPAC